jgi:hypothetical protein
VLAHISTLTRQGIRLVFAFLAVKQTAPKVEIKNLTLKYMNRYEVIISSVEYQRVLVEADNEQEAEYKALDDFLAGAIGEIVFDYDAKVEIEKMQEIQSPIALPKVEIRGKWYYRDDRLRQYRNIEKPYEFLSFEEAP